MYQQKKQKDYRSLWAISIAVLAIGILLTIRMAMIRPLGYGLLAVGAFGLIWSLANMDKWNDKKDNEEHHNQQHYN